MNANSIVYTSNTGYTAEYARLLGDKTGLPVYSLAEAEQKLAAGNCVIYLGWLMAGKVQGYKKAAKRYKVQAVCGVGMGGNGSQLQEVRKANAIPEKTPLFTLQGGIDRSRLKGMDKLMISLLAKGLAAQKQRSAQDERMLELLNKDESYVSSENLAEVVQWYREEQL